MNKRIHAKYFSRFLNLLPPRLSCHDSTRATIAFFAVSGLDVLDSLDLLSDEAKQNIINWMYQLQVITKGKKSFGGFQVCGYTWSKVTKFSDKYHICRVQQL